MMIIVGYTEGKTCSDSLNSLLSELYNIAKPSVKYCSKSYIGKTASIVLGNNAVACDVVNTKDFLPMETLNNKLKFYTDDAVRQRIMCAPDKAYQAAKLWSRKECIYKLWNIRNKFAAQKIHNNKNIIMLDDYVINTRMFDNKKKLISFMYPKTIKKIKIYELISGELYEKL